ncbi:MAG: DsrE/DsrF/DrsH-like family protein [Armatimonadetes bacterium]|nr:DsrE/DsrF/DrsH-like family protein [Armatimonadota bacterium]
MEESQEKTLKENEIKEREKVEEVQAQTSSQQPEQTKGVDILNVRNFLTQEEGKEQQPPAPIAQEEEEEEVIPVKKKITFFMFSGDFDKAFAALNLAVVGASFGFEVVIFFSWWGLNIIRKDQMFHKSKIKGFFRKLMAFFNHGGIKHLPMTQHNFFGLSPYFLNKCWKENQSLTLQEWLKVAKERGVKFIACGNLSETLGFCKEDLLPIVDEYGTQIDFLSSIADGGFALWV